MAKVKIVKNERDPSFFTGKLLINSRVIGLDMKENRIFTLNVI
jgi:hypothetical protein